MCANVELHTKNEHRYLFARQLQFTANENLAVERSDHFVKPRFMPEQDIWKKRPPDFSVKLYKSLHLPRKLVEVDKRGKKHTNKMEAPKQGNSLQVIPDDQLPNIMRKEKFPKFQTKFKHVGQFEDALMVVKNGQYPKDKYKDPKLHDFRQYETGIPDFNTSYSRDPFNIKLKSQNVSFVYGHLPEKMTKSYANNFKTHKPSDPTWDSTLILPKIPWPPKSASFTKHRRRRGVYTAFMDRVEEKFTAGQQ
ncbi:uncharacterized protein LOC128497947 [Spea bombifrons]|uniref:uncharacterized protein LOC128497947 n=1 Tax=Spea bombifrons TaxID=233779 RepID=UPI0023490AAC|nr:uncharacterized protein LOC128497947 [Spea bombifrons]